MFLRNSTRIYQLEKEVSSLRKELKAIATHLGIEPNTPRRWERHSSPINRMAIDTDPTKCLPAVHFEPSIDQITIDQNLYVRVYSNGHCILPYCGHISKVSEELKVRAPHIKKWEQVVTRGARPSSPLPNFETPIPQAV